MKDNWFWQPNVEWLNTVNTTNLRTVNAIRGFVMTGVVWAILTMGVTWHALHRCASAVPAITGVDSLAFRLMRSRIACEESTSIGRLLEFVAGLFDTWSLLLFGMAGVAVGGAIAKRLTDTSHRVAVAQAQKAPIIVAPPTSEYPVPPAKTEVNVTVEKPE